jgi:acyl-CoA synthetase (AMP-forming)/AMP-acid ligase II
MAKTKRREIAMQSRLDVRIEQAIHDLTKEGGLLPLSEFTLPSGVAVPIIASAPPTLNAYFAHYCAEHGDADFIVDGNERISFTQGYAAAVEVANALVGGFGIKPGDRVGIAMRNAPSWIILYMGTLMAGGVVTLLNGWWQGSELFNGIENVQAKLVTPSAKSCLSTLHCRWPKRSSPLRHGRTDKSPFPKSGRTIWRPSCSPADRPASRKERFRPIDRWCRPLIVILQPPS